MLLFAVEAPNIYQDNLLESELLLAHSIASADTPEDISRFLQQLEFLKAGSGTGPLGMLGHDLVCKMAYRLIVRFDRLTIEEKKGLICHSDLIDVLRVSI